MVDSKYSDVESSHVVACYIDFKRKIILFYDPLSDKNYKKKF